VNSFSGVEKAIELEIERQIGMLEAGGRVRPADAALGRPPRAVSPMRSKEESHDYRYFPDPDLPPLVVTAERVREIQDALPELPAARRERFMSAYGLSAYDAEVLTHARAGADYFEAVAEATGEPKAAANWVMGPAQALMNERREDAATFAVPPDALAELIALVRDGAVSDSVAKTVLGVVAAEGGRPREIVEARGLTQVRDDAQLEAWIAAAIGEHADEVARYRSGEKKLLGFLVGQVMKRSAGKADPRRVNELLRKALEAS
jgi:aspartyl-tRNA(Asn)/glutamyl-tRNA(Gln) amidotransferase subunit B